MAANVPTRLRRACLLLVVLAALALAGCAGEGPAEPATTIDRNETVPAGSFVELNLAMNESAELTYRWSTSPETTLGFDVHSHADGQTRYHERFNATTGEGSFTAPAEGTYSLLWENAGGETVTVELHVEGDVRLDSVAP